MILSAYDKIYHLGHREVKDIFKSPFVIQEKVDGSQISFGVIGGELHIRSKNKEIDLDAPEKLFTPAVETIWRAFTTNKLIEGWVYRGEAFAKPKHNTLAYSRVPIGNIALFDVTLDSGECAHYSLLGSTANVIGTEVVKQFDVEYPTHFDPETLNMFLAQESFLGGPKIEGIVIKNYAPIAPVPYGGRVLMAKYVSEAFKELHQVNWKNTNPGKKDITQNLIVMLKTDARWDKAIQHLREQGLLLDDPKDIGKLIDEIRRDVLEEESEMIKQKLFDAIWNKEIARGITAGFPEYYKKKLVTENYNLYKDMEEYCRDMCIHGVNPKEQCVACNDLADGVYKCSKCNAGTYHKNKKCLKCETINTCEESYI